MGNQKILEDILAYNKHFVQDKQYEIYATTKEPNKKLVILSCMDTRLTELLPKALNIKNGDAKIIKNAGATIMHPFGSITRSILVAIYEFHAEDVIVVGHHGCGMSHLDTENLMNKIRQRGITDEMITTLQHAGIDVLQWLHGFESIEEAIRESVHSIKHHPLIPRDIHVHGLVMDPYTGKIDVVVNGYE